jgi:AraC-like DNA-binding protein
MPQMPRAKNGPALGVIQPLEPDIRLTRYYPAADLAPFVEHYWIVRWRVDEPRVQETLPSPSVHIVVEDGASGVFGIVRGRFCKHLYGQGRAVAIRLRPGAFASFLARPQRHVTGRVLPLVDAFGDSGSAYEQAVLNAPLIGLAESFLRAREPRADELLDLIARAMELVHNESQMTRVADLASALGVTVRSLQRLFSDRVGVSPKWVLCRARLQEVAARVVVGESINWPRLAIDLGYFDQAHLIRAYRSVIGMTPAEHARRFRGRADDR